MFAYSLTISRRMRGFIAKTIRKHINNVFNDEELIKENNTQKLQDVGLDVKSVNALNKIMEKMGLLIHYGNGGGQRFFDDFGDVLL